MKILIAGSRIYPKHLHSSIIQYISNILDLFGDKPISDLTIISGAATGIDALGEKIADKLKCNKSIHKPDWEKYGKSAGPMRNIEMVEECDLAILVWDGESKGTKHTLDTLISKGKPFFLYRFAS